MKELFTWAFHNIDQKLLKEGSYFCIILILLGSLIYVIKTDRVELIDAMQEQSVRNTTVQKDTNEVLREMTAAIVQSTEINKQILNFKK